MAIMFGPGKGGKKKDQPKSKIGGGLGRTTTGSGYKMGLIRNERDTKTPTKTITMGAGPGAPSYTQQQGIIGPVPVGQGGKTAAAPKKKSAVGKVMKKVGRDIDYAAGQVKNALTRSNVKKYSFNKSGGGSRGGGGKSCAAYR